MTTVTRWIASPSDVAEGLSHTRFLLLLRWRMIRSTYSRVSIFFGLGLAFLMVILASNAGSAVRAIATTNYSSAAGQFAVNYLVALQRGELGAVGSVTFATALMASFVSPLTGSSNLALTSPSNLTILRPRRLHRYFDALAIHSMSTIGLMQIVMLTALASLITITGGRFTALMVTWYVWVILTVVSTVVGWTIEVLYRKYGQRTRIAIFVGFTLLVGGLWLIWPEQATNLWGVGNGYLAMVQPGQTLVSFATNMLILTVLLFLLLGLGMALCTKALSMPAPVDRVKGDSRWARRLSSNGNIALFQILMRQTWRISEVKRPMATILFIAIPIVWITKGDDVAMTTLVIAAPLAVGLAWAVNVFGILGPGMTWLAAQPNVMRKLPILSSAVGAVIIAAVVAIAWIPPLFGGVVQPLTVVSVAAGSIVASVMTLRSSAAKSINRPFLVKLGSRGDTVVPPLTAVNYTLRFALWGGQLGVLVMSQTDVMFQWLLVAGFVTWAAIRYLMLMRTWSDRTEQARVVAVVSAA